MEESQGSSAEGNRSARPDVGAPGFLSPAPRSLGGGSDSTSTAEGLQAGEKQEPILQGSWGPEGL